MKKILFLSALILPAIGAFAQDHTQNVVKADPVALILGTASIAYERAFSAKSSVLIRPSFASFKQPDFRHILFQLDTDYRRYLLPKKIAPVGLYASPGVSYIWGSFKWDSLKISANGYAIRGVAGYQWIWNSGFTLDLNGGVEYFVLNIKETDNFNIDVDTSRIRPRINFSLGYAF